MYIEITLDRNELESLVRQAAPLRIHLTERDEDRRWIELSEPHDLELLEERGLRIHCVGQIKYSIVGLHLPVEISRLQIVLEPQLAHTDGRLALHFAIDIEDADLKNLPQFLDKRVVDRANARVTPEATHMIWRFGEQLTVDLPLPSRLEPLASFGLRVIDADVRVSEQSVLFRVELDARLDRSKPVPTDGADDPNPSD